MFGRMVVEVGVVEVGVVEVGVEDVVEVVVEVGVFVVLVDVAGHDLTSQSKQIALAIISLLPE